MRKEIAFSQENRERHFCHNSNYITTTRARLLGDIGTEFVIYDPVHIPRLFRLEAIFVATPAVLYNCILSLLNQPRAPLWWHEGFYSNSDFIEELYRIYPERKVFYVHFLAQVSPEEAAGGDIMT